MRLRRWITYVAVLALGALVGVLFWSPTSQETVGAQDPLRGVMQARNLSLDDALAALRTYTPTGVLDDYIMFASGGHSGQVLVIGLPSMRILKVLAVFAPEPWQGYAVGNKETETILKAGGKDITWGDVHHPALSETQGDYDGQFLFVNDKANGRVAVIDLRDFKTKQIVKNPLIYSNHCSAFVTPNTEYIAEAPQYSMPYPVGTYAPLEQYKEKYRGPITFWKFDRTKGRIVPEQSFAIELPPYWHDLCDAGKRVSYGWAFCNSFNTEMAVPNILQMKMPLEATTARNEMDYLHVINWKAAEKLIQEGKYETVAGMKLIPLATAVQAGVLYLIPEPKSPHGVDVSPDGNYIVVAGKLDPHATVYSFEKIQQAIRQGLFEGKDPYGVPILKFDATKAAQVELGLGPLHTQFDDKGYAYTSLFLDSAVVKWSLGEPYFRGDQAWKVVDKVSVHYNIGHLTAVHGDTTRPRGKFLVALNKWSIDRFAPVGPLHPQNFQLIDISGAKMQRLYDLPIPIGEPHYAQIIERSLLKPLEVYPQVGFNPITMAADPAHTVQPGKERIERRGNTVEVWMTAIRSTYTPDRIEVQEGDRVIIHLTNLERTRDATHGFAIAAYNINVSVDPGENATIEFIADKPGVYPFYCTEFCSALHLEMAGYLLVKPRPKQALK
jgi:nitrous-oxide reductase